VNSIAETPRPRPLQGRTLVIAALALLLAAVGTAAMLIRMTAAESGPKAPTHVVAAPTSAAIEARYGIRVKQIGLTADGGILDMRFVVLDPKKAHQLAHAGVKMRLVVEQDNRLLDSEAMAPHGGLLRAGSTYFALFRNDGNLLSAGSRVTLEVGDLRLEHLTVI
jgi:hypothetical protein